MPFAFLIDLQQCYRGGLGIGPLLALQEMDWTRRRRLLSCGIGPADRPPQAPKATLHCPGRLAPDILDHLKSDTKCPFPPHCPCPRVVSQIEHSGEEQQTILNLKFVQQAATMHVSDYPIVNRYQVNIQLCTTEDTNASFWDSSLPGTQDEPLDDGELRTKLASVVRSSS